MKNAIILHGAPEKEHYYDPTKPSESNAHWIPWLQKELMIRDIKADTPEVPHSYEPKWEVWCKEVERFDITQDTILVGHSAGAGFWLRYLSENPMLSAGKVYLIAPWMDPDKTLREDTFYDFKFGADVLNRTGGVHVWYASDDSENVQTTVSRIKAEMHGAQYRKFGDGYGHFTYENLRGSAFVELRDAIIA